MSDFLKAIADPFQPLPVEWRHAHPTEPGEPDEPQREGMFLPPELAALEPDEFEFFRTPRGSPCGWRLTGKGRERHAKARGKGKAKT